MDHLSYAQAEDVGGRRTLRPKTGARAENQQDSGPYQWHRGMTLIAVISLFIGTRSAWTHAITADLPVAGIITACYAGILVTGVLALAVQGSRAMARVDFAVLVVGITLVISTYWLNHTIGDEGTLTAQAAKEILVGRPIYGQPWPWLFGTPHVGITKTMSGGADYTYAYPPLTALLVAPVYAVIRSTTAAALVPTAALLTGTVVLWRQLPPPWRSTATAVCLGFGLLPGYARSGYPALVALAFLVPVVVRWPATGAGGRLGRYGVIRATCLGAACATQQLAWFLALFLLVGIYAVRRGELGGRPSLAVTARYTGVAALTWALVNVYFAAQDAAGWLNGSFLPFSQGAILHGQGIMGISYYFTAGSSRLDFYSYAAVLLLVGLVGALFCFPRRLGPALTVLPWLSFYVATRSQDGYYLLMTPLWLAAAATVPARSVRDAWQPRFPCASTPRAKAITVAGLTAPALACVGVAALSPPPLHMTLAPRLANRVHRGITSVAVRTVNTTGSTLALHFASRNGQGASNWWTISSGPAVLRPHTAASYVVRPPGGFRAVPSGGHPRMYLIAVSGTPMTLTTSQIPMTTPSDGRGTP